MIAALPAALIFAGSGTAKAEQTIEEVGAFVCVMDKWVEKELDKGHKVVDLSARCVDVPDDELDPKYTQVCPGKYEYMPDESWKATGTCTDTYKSGDTKTEAWEEGSALRSTRTKSPAAPVNIRAPVVAAHTTMKISPTHCRAGGTKARSCCLKVVAGQARRAQFR